MHRRASIIPGPSDHGLQMRPCAAAQSLRFSTCWEDVITTVTLGMTGLEVYPIAFGAWQLGGEWGENSTSSRRSPRSATNVN
jgi:hypothetical protein